jgi:hypothetical protein
MLLLALCAALAPSSPAGQVAGNPPAQTPVVAPQSEPIADPQEQDPTATVDARLYSLFEGALLDSRNGGPIAESPGYAKLVASVSSFSPEEVTARSKEVLDIGGLIRDADARRGEFVRVVGLLGSMEAVKLEQPIFGAQDVFRGAVGPADGSVGVIFDMLERPSDFELLKDVVEVEGVFYRTVQYESRDGKTVEAPWLIAKSLRPVDTKVLEKTTSTNPLMIMLIGAAIAFLIFRLLMFLSQRRKLRGRPAKPSTPSIRELMERERKK